MFSFTKEENDMYKFSNFTAKANEALNIEIESAESMGND